MPLGNGPPLLYFQTDFIKDPNADGQGSNIPQYYKKVRDKKVEHLNIAQLERVTQNGYD